MYVVPKKANDMMNVGMLECYTVTELFHFLYAFFMKNVVSLKHGTTFCSDTIFFSRSFFTGQDTSFGNTDYAGKFSNMQHVNRLLSHLAYTIAGCLYSTLDLV